MAQKVYTVHLRGELDAATPDVVFVKEGFCWPALFLPLVWMLYRMQWLGLLAYVLGSLLIAGIGYLFDPTETTGTLFSIAFTVLAAMHANDWRRWRLGARGYRLIDVAAGRNLDEAEIAWFHRNAAGLPAAEQPAKAATPAAVPRPASRLTAFASPFDPT